ncbi:Inherit from COG: conserved protein [Seminavis robusta]|uniref:Inherit from COG: conserved protein n=1 Tax=Seminavis robusta TaxID=568900 RepID=A0A9N8HG85_9STRA|nr:Inherit from COG: conserved protein [Seminavis robusta]|eukprot:Sro496_g154580.1 Inherit from COG: conserved protein (530) ;mRNA; f:17742-19455
MFRGLLLVAIHFVLSSGFLGERPKSKAASRVLHDVNEDAAARYEDALVELESEALYRLGCQQSDLSDFCNKLERGSLNLFPEYQRAFVWEPAKSSRLVATVLCNRFIPPLVLHEKSKGVFDVVDGKQRLTTLLGFFMSRKDARFPGDPVIKEKMIKLLPSLSRLSKLDESYEALNGLSFDDLDLDRQRAFESYAMSYMVIPLDTPRADVFEVYEDINSGGTDLTQQQVRRAVFHGPYMKMIDTLKDTCTDFHAIRNPKAFQSGTYQTCKKDSDGELVLRAFAFRNNGDKFKPSIKKFLNRELEGSEDYGISPRGKKKGNEQQRLILLQKMVAEQRHEFESVIRVARQVFGTSAFRKKKESLSNTMWDAKYCAIAELLAVHREVDFTRAKDHIAKALEYSIQFGFFSEDDEKTTAIKFLARKEHLKRIFQDALQEASVQRDTRRQFSPKLKQQLFEEQNGLCGLCEQTIDEQRLDEANYVHIDHIIPHSKGGRTTESNAQLTHSECNLHKGSKHVEQNKLTLPVSEERRQ